jgi:hypothetical protein
MIIDPPKYPLADSPGKFLAVKAILTERGYRRIKKKAGREFFRAPWSWGDVQHLVIPINGGRSKQGLGLRYGLYDEELEQFSMDSVVGFNRRDPADANERQRMFCLLAFATFTRAKQGPGASPWGLFLCDHTTDEIVTMVQDKLDREIEPPLRSVTDMQSYFHALASDSDAFPWWQVSAEIRAAQAVALGARLGMSDAAIKDTLMLQQANIEGPAVLGKSANRYLDFVIQAAQKFRLN